jgi:hypothetical protein
LPRCVAKLGAFTLFVVTPWLCTRSAAQGAAQTTIKVAALKVSIGAEVDHAYTHAGTFPVRIHATGLDGSASEQSSSITIRGAISTKYVPGDKRRLTITAP